MVAMTTRSLRSQRSPCCDTVHRGRRRNVRHVVRGVVLACAGMLLIASTWQSVTISLPVIGEAQSHVVIVDQPPPATSVSPSRPNNDDNRTVGVTPNSTIVTAYFSVNNAKHTGDEYLEWMTNMLSLSDNMVIFTTPDKVSTIQKLRANSRHGQTRVVAMHISDFKMATTPYDTDFWQHQFAIDPEGGAATDPDEKHHLTYQLYQVWNEKSHFLKNVTDWNPFQSDFFAWVDIGYFRTTTYNHQVMLQSIPRILRHDQVLLLDVSTLLENDLKYIGGGFIGGYTLGIQRWHKHYYEMLEQEGKSTFIGKDQPIMYKTCQQQPGLCQLVIPDDTHGDPWFYMAPYLNKENTHLLHPPVKYLRKLWTDGRTGNQMFEWASTLGIAAKNDMVACMDPTSWNGGQDLAGTFVGPFEECPLPVLSEEEPSLLEQQQQLIETQGYARYNHHFLDIHNTKATNVQFYKYTYLQSFRYFADYDLEIQRIFQFRHDITSKAQAILAPYQNKTTVGIHVRRGDMLKESNQYLQMPSVQFYENVMEYFQNQYQNNDVVFLVASDDVAWCQDVLLFRKNSPYNVVFTRGETPSVDMAVLAGCQHMVVSVGTFGWWAAWLGAHSHGGQVLYYANQFNMSHPNNVGSVVLEDYFPATWKSMGDTKRPVGFWAKAVKLFDRD